MVIVVEEGMERGMTGDHDELGSLESEGENNEDVSVPSPESSFTKMRRLSTASVVERIESVFERSEASDEDLEERMMLAWMLYQRKHERLKVFNKGGVESSEPFVDVSTL